MTKEQIKEELDKAYKEVGHSTYFEKGFEAGVKFALGAPNVPSNSDYAKCGKCGGTGKYLYSIEYRGVCDECDGKGHFA